MSFSVILAGASVRSLAERALADGHRPLAVDMFGDADLRKRLPQTDLISRFRRIGSFDELPTAIDDVPHDIPLVWSGGLENFPEILAALKLRRRVCGATAESIRRVRDPLQLARWLANSGCRLPETLSAADGRSGVRPANGWLSKPIDGSGGLGIAFAESFDATCDGDRYLQRHIPGIPISGTFVADDAGCAFVGATLQLVGEPALGARGFWFCGNAGPLELSPTVRSRVRSAGERIREAGIRGVFGIDFVVRGTEVWVLEVNPRLTASHEIFELTGASSSLLRQHLDVLMHGLNESRALLSGKRRRIARGIVYSRRNGELSVSDAARLMAWTRSIRPDSRPNATELPSYWIADVPSAGEFSAGRPFCSVYCRLPGDLVEGGPGGIEAEVARHTGLADLQLEHLKAKCSGLFERIRNGDNADHGTNE